MNLESMQLGHYKLMRLIGRGGMGEVYLAEDMRIERQVAIKIVFQEVLSYVETEETKAAERLFRREMNIIARFDHPRILPLYDYGEEEIAAGRCTYMVMPYRPEGSFSDWLRQYHSTGPLPPQDVVHIINQSADALQCAHDAGIIHQDIKPSNFLIRSRKDHLYQPDLLLADFGAAKAMSMSMTASQNVRGTPTYMAPEQWEGSPVPATDQYALGVMAYQLLTGTRPFQGNSMQVMYKHLNEQPVPLTRLNPRLTEGINSAVLRSMAKRVERRFSSVSDFARALQFAVEASSFTSSAAPEVSYRPATRQLETPPSVPVSAAEPVAHVETEPLSAETQEQGPASPLPEAPAALPQRSQFLRPNRIVQQPAQPQPAVAEESQRPQQRPLSSRPLAMDQTASVQLQFPSQRAPASYSRAEARNYETVVPPTSRRSTTQLSTSTVPPSTPPRSTRPSNPSFLTDIEDDSQPPSLPDDDLDDEELSDEEDFLDEEEPDEYEEAEEGDEQEETDDATMLYADRHPAPHPLKSLLYDETTSLLTSFSLRERRQLTSVVAVTVAILVIITLIFFLFQYLLLPPATIQPHRLSSVSRSGASAATATAHANNRGVISKQPTTMATGQASTATVPATQPAGSLPLNGTVTLSDAPVDLSATGTLDWVQWGLTNATSVDRKDLKTTSHQISDFMLVVPGSGPVQRDTTDPISFSWSGGTPDATVAGTRSGISLTGGVDNGFRITVPATTTSRTLLVYVGVGYGRGELTATLPGFSTYHDDSLDLTSANASASTANAFYTLSYKSNDPGAVLTVTYTLEQSNGTHGFVELEAAALQPGTLS